MAAFQAPRGTTDRLPPEQKYWRYVEDAAVSVARRFGYGRIDSPMFEDAGLFVRGVGAGTDIVEKEMYVFADRGGDQLTLRAEGTAPVCRAYLQHGMSNRPQPVRMYYLCPVFRYERPQAGRFRQHHQFGVEAIGDGDPSVDAEVIELAWTLMHDIGLSDLALLVNSIGDPECRPEYMAALKAYYEKQRAHLCGDCRQRLERNPLRLLDCKVETCRALGNDAPKSVECLCAGCESHWQSVQSYLKAAGIPARVDHRLVRGLDYYTRTVFEIQPAVGGAQSTVCGGGRYDGLMEQAGGAAHAGHRVRQRPGTADTQPATRRNAGGRGAVPAVSDCNGRRGSAAGRRAPGAAAADGGCGGDTGQRRAGAARADAAGQCPGGRRGAHPGRGRGAGRHGGGAGFADIGAAGRCGRNLSG